MNMAPEHATAAVYVVTVEHNLVSAIARVPEGSVGAVPETTLEVGTELAANYRRDGCLDGRYLFRSAQRARIFATLCLEFTQALIERRLTVVKALRADEEFDARAAPPGT
jgi:hypothetical protein